MPTALNDGAYESTPAGTISWFILDSDDNIVGSVVNQMHSGGWVDGTGNTLLSSDWANYNDKNPDVLSIWVNNQPVGIGNPEDYYGSWNYEPITDWAFFNEPTTSHVSLLLDYITIDGYKNKISNGSITPLKSGGGAKLSIDSAPSDILSHYHYSSYSAHPNGNKIETYEAKGNTSLLTSGNTQPSYLTWGFEIGRGNDNTFTNPTSGFMDYTDKGNLDIFMGGFECATPSQNDSTDATKRILNDKTSYVTTGTGQGEGTATSDVYFFYPVREQRTGFWLENIRRGGHDATLRVNERPYLNDVIHIDGDNRVDNFTKKGFISLKRGELLETTHPTHASDEKWYPRENPLFSAKITKIIDAERGIIEVDNTNLLKTFEDDEIILYRAGYQLTDSEWTSETGTAACSPFIRRKLKIDTDYINTVGTSGETGDNVIRIRNMSNVTSTPNSAALPISGADTYHPESTYSRHTDRHIILNEKFLSELYISPLRYWMAAEIYNHSETFDEVLPYKKYTHSVLFEGGDAMVGHTKGPTFNESKYSDTSIYSNRWSIDKNENNGLIEVTNDYGFGAYSDSEDFVSRDFESSAGYINKFIPKEQQFNKISLRGYVLKNEKKIISQRDKLNFALLSSPETDGTGTFLTPNSSDKGRHPFITYVFNDTLPSLTNFTIEPDKKTQFYPTFKWDSQDNDLWYGFIIIDNKYIDNQYHSAVLHLPFNDLDSLDYGTTDSSGGRGLKGYRYDGSNVGVSFDINDGLYHSVHNVHASGVMITEEGLAGNALLFHGYTDSAEFKSDYGSWKGYHQGTDAFTQFVEVDESNFTQPTSEMSIVVHFTVNSLGDSGGGVGEQTNDVATILEKYMEYKLWIDTTGYINYRQFFSNIGYVDLKSTSLVPTDNYTPTNVILTFDSTLGNGNVKMFVNGVLESQTGTKETTGGVNNWQSGNINDYTTVVTNNKRLRIGASKRNLAEDYTAPIERFNGKLEEIVIYNKAIYPIVPQNKEFTLFKPFSELSIDSIGVSKDNVAKLFIKDYHNIRGRSNDEVTSSASLTINKSGVGLKTN